MKSFEKSYLLSEFSEEEIEEFYCVKIGTYVPGGCPLKECNDVDSCPYASQPVSLN